MPLRSRLSNEAVSVALDAKTALLANGFMDLYDGVQPDNVDDPITTQTLLATCTLGDPAFSPAVNGQADLATPALGVGVANGTATWLRLWKSDHSSPVHDGSVGSSGSNLNLTSALIISGGALTIEHYVLTDRKSG